MNEVLTGTQSLGTYFNESKKVNLDYIIIFIISEKNLHTFSVPEFIKHFQANISFNPLNSQTIISISTNEKTEYRG